MRKVLLTIAFDGTAYLGWQAQCSGRGVANALLQACCALSGETPEIISSSRTDAGVHARALCAHLIVPESIHHLSAVSLRNSLNAHLANDVRITAVAEVGPDFNARFDALRKEYHYQIWNQGIMSPLLQQQAWHVPFSLDEATMHQAAALFMGRHDFRAFTSNRNGVLGDSVREITRCEIQRADDLWKIKIQASGFLYKMCRCMVGTLLQVARHRMSLEELSALLQGGDRQASGMNAPAHGLSLWQVDYPPDVFL